MYPSFAVSSRASDVSADRHPVEAMRIVMMVAGVLLFFVGCVWILQGINVLPGSFMTGQTKWAVIGTITVVIGIVLVVLARRGAAP
jgi:uncharacterized membrane protein HdeD (DUF308 family)